MNKLPIYEALISNEDDGLLVMSLVTYPATEKNWLAFNDIKPIQKFSIEDDEKHVLLGVVMLADTPIFRRDVDGYEYYIKYSKETLEKMAEKMLVDNTFNNVDLQHNGEILQKGVVTLRELFIKDESKGVVPVGFEDIPDGSLLCSYKINNEELWESCKKGEFNGFSLEGLFTIEKIKQNKQKNNRFSMNKIKEMLAKILASFGEVKTDKGVLSYEGEELAEGIEVTDENGEAVEDGDYVAEDGRTIVVKDSKVEEIKEAETEEEEVTEEEPTEEVEAEEETTEPIVEEEIITEPTVDNTAELDEIRNEINSLRNELTALKEQIVELVNKPAIESVQEEFNRIAESNLDKWGQALRNIYGTN